MNWTEKLETTRDRLRDLRKAIPDTTRAFGGLGESAQKAGALDERTKEFIALGIAVAVRCEECILFHTQGLIRRGATREEVAEALGLTIEMGGGPSMMYAAKALECFDELSAQAAG